MVKRGESTVPLHGAYKVNFYVLNFSTKAPRSG